MSQNIMKIQFVVWFVNRNDQAMPDTVIWIKPKKHQNYTTANKYEITDIF